ncbi:hypothetical protein FO488_19055 [Geobacter sp. FeAm09]|uniref:hypothetical protein n=1 Tax=Geobacter sp. FeAm09 TaxID=2597769 RepID=UPI0011EBFD3C|nr:hypothetical protein [Geobacter sp. FeAm09]QEM70047.1 hypothetical protein FO488_19055 [Geobacter sp. FeAm09]
MAPTKEQCSHCGSIVKAGSNGIYSVRVDSKGYLMEIMDGEILPDTFHYCSPGCMFKRERGVVPRAKIAFHF